MTEAVLEHVPLETRLSRLAQMPSDPDRALARLTALVGAAWAALEPHAGSIVLPAVRDTAPHAPGCGNCSAADLDGVLRTLDCVLAQRHPEEIRVFAYALLGGIAESTREHSGAASARSLVARLEQVCEPDVS